MADNVVVPAESGTTVATDDIGGIHYQKVQSVVKRNDETIVSEWYDSGAISNADVNSLETVAEIDCTGFKILYASFTTTVALTEFTVAFRVHASGDYFVVANSSDDFNVPEGVILGASGDLTTAAISTTHWLKLDVEGVQQVRLQAASTAATVAGHYGLN